PHVQVERLIQRSQIDFAQSLRHHRPHTIHDGIHRVLFADYPQQFLGLAGIGQIAAIQVARKIDVGRIARHPHHMATLIGQPLTDGPTNAFGRPRHKHTTVFHSGSPEDEACKTRRGTRGVIAVSNSYPMVPQDNATSSTEGPPAPHSTTSDPTCACGTGSRSTPSMSIETRPSSRVRTPATVIGVPVPACLG